MSKEHLNEDFLQGKISDLPNPLSLPTGLSEKDLRKIAKEMPEAIRKGKELREKVKQFTGKDYVVRDDYIKYREYVESKSLQEGMYSQSKKKVSSKYLNSIKKNESVEDPKKVRLLEDRVKTLESMVKTLTTKLDLMSNRINDIHLRDWSRKKSQ